MNVKAFLLVFFFLSFKSWAITIPKHLSSEDRRVLVQTLGINTSSKVLGNPYPLGGYWGLEFSVSMELVDLTNLQALGCEPGSPGCPNGESAKDQELTYARLTFGKGLFNDLDFFLSFIPPSSGQRLSDFGGSLRWTFFKAKFAPINLLTVLHGTQMNFNDALSSITFGGDLLVGINVENFALYFGTGLLQSNAKFVAGTGSDSLIAPGDPNVDPSNNLVFEEVRSTHSVVGVSLHYSDYFAAAQIDRYQDPVYSAKLGLRF